MNYIKGADISTLIEVESCGGKYYDAEGKETELLSFLKKQGIDTVRIRLWHDPYDEDGNPYGAGTNDLSCFIKLSRRAREAGLKVLLDYHYSDFWTDPGKQFKPKAWGAFNADQLEEAVYEYTKETLSVLRNEGLSPYMIQIGNELSNGLLWPEGKVPAYGNIARFVNAGLKAATEISPESIRMIHLDNGGNNGLYRGWFDSYFEEGGADFDVIGLSYYPFWHGTLADLSANMNDIALRYHKDLLIAEVSTGFTMEDYAHYEGLSAEERIGYATKEALVGKIEHPMTKEGQCAFLKALFRVIDEVPEGRGRGFIYWEPGWIPVPGSGWATKEALKYLDSPGPVGNEWANQALFDYEGHALPAWEVIRDHAGI
ncbi:MAG: glycosyl hydrolase 53 family protein [Lachnospiraceae bacterium]|nr:glycosyl hydrolase 53 family protein [Lachnospiraceae bacterium]